MGGRRDKLRNEWINAAAAQLDGSGLIDPTSSHVAEWFENAYDGKVFRIIKQRLKKFGAASSPGFLRMVWAAATRLNKANPLAPIADFFNQFNLAAPISQAQADEWLKDTLQEETDKRPATEEQMNRYRQLYEIGFFSEAEHKHYVKKFGEEPTAAQMEMMIAKFLRRARVRGKLPPCGERDFYPQFANCPTAKPIHIEYCRALPVRRKAAKAAATTKKRAKK